VTQSALRRMHDTSEMVAKPDEDVRGRAVLDNTGKHIGTVDDLIIDETHKKVRFLRVECGGFLGIGATHLMIPVDAITSINGDAVTIDREGKHLHGAPRYNPELVIDSGESYWGDVYTYYGFAPFWGPGYTHPRYPYFTV